MDIALNHCKQCNGNGGDVVVEIVFIRPQGGCRITCKFCDYTIHGNVSSLSSLIEQWNKPKEETS